MKFLLLSIFIFFNIQIVNAQSDFSKNSLKFSAGLGFLDSYKNDILGPGTSYSIGYQREIWRDKLRINPFLSIGFFTNKFTTDIPDAYCNSINLQNNFYFDLVKLKSVSFVIGGGLFFNNLRGLIGTGGDPGTNRSQYINEYNFGGYGGAGIRINPKNKRLAFDLMPINMNYGLNDFTEFTLRICVDYKLK